MASGDWCIWQPGDSRIRNNVLNSQGRRDITGETRYARQSVLYTNADNAKTAFPSHMYTETADSEAEHETSIGLGAENLTSVDGELKSCLRVRVTD